MPARLKPEFVYSALKARGITHRSPYVYANEKMDLECDTCGHNWPATYDNIKQGRGCPRCSKKEAQTKLSESKRTPKDEINKTLEKYGAAVGQNYINTKIEATFTCLRCGHEWEDTVRLMRQRNAETYLCPKEKADERSAARERAVPKTKIGQSAANKKVTRSMNSVPKALRDVFSNYEECCEFLMSDLKSRVETNGGSGDFGMRHLSITTTPVEYKCNRGHEESRSLMEAYSLAHLCQECLAEFETSPRAKKRSWPKRAPYFSGRVPSDEYLQLLSTSNIDFLGLETKGNADLARTICRTCRQLHKKSVKRLNQREISPLCSCSDPTMKKTFASRLLAKVEEKNGFLVSEVIERSKDYYTFQCAEKHDPWPAEGGSVVYANSWCPVCSGNLPRDLIELKELIESRGGKLISTKNEGVDGSYDYTCSLGHPNTNIWKKIEAGQWCNVCNKSGKSEEIARHMLQEILSHPFPKKRPRWLRNSRDRQMELDGYSEDLGIAFEYQGEQHFKQSSRYGGNLEQRIKDDQRKSELCKQNKVCLLIVTYEDEYSDFPKIFRAQLEDFGFDTRGYDFDSEIDLAGAYIRDDRIEELREKLATRDLELISTKFIKVDTLYEIRCKKCDSKFEAPANRYLSNSRGPAGCDKCTRTSEAALERLGLGIEELMKFAHARKGRLLSTKYRGSHYKYWWDCGNHGHLYFRASFANMKFRNQFCPYCENRTDKSRRIHEIGTLLWKMGREPSDALTKHSEQLETTCLHCGMVEEISISKFEGDPSPCCLVSSANDSVTNF